MPSKKSLEIITLKKEINTLNKKIDDQVPLQEIKNITIQEKKDQPYGLIDLIAGITPTFSGWTNNPTDAADITDNDPATSCTTGNKVAGVGWQYGYFEWDLGSFYNVLCTGHGGVAVDAGTPTGYIEFWDGAAWHRSDSPFITSAAVTGFRIASSVCSKVRFGIGSSAAATITPNIREFYIWRLK